MSEEALVFFTVGIAHCGVCVATDVALEEIEPEVNHRHPSGVRPWRLSERAQPVACSDHPNRLHYLLEC